jgi:cytochrome P450
MGHWGDFVKEPLRFHLRLAKEMGDILRFRVGVWWIYMVNHPDHVQYIFQGNQRNFNKQTADYDMLKLAAGEGLLTSDGEFWRKQRRMIQPMFHRKRLEVYGEMMVEEASRMADHLGALSRKGEAVDMADEMLELALRIVGRALFRVDLAGSSKEIGASFGVVSRHLGTFDWVSMLPQWMPLPRMRQFRKAMSHLNGIVFDMIARRKDEIAQEGEGGVITGEDDLLRLLLSVRDPDTGEQMSLQQVRDEAITLLIAGHETSANALSWIWWLLSQHPKAEEALWDELDSVLGGRLPTLADLPALPYTQMVIEEAMRLYPPAWITSRNVVADDEIAGYPIPKKSVVLMLPYTTHRHPAFWEEPEAFRPERFSPANKAKQHKFAYFPFGGGPRLCIGKHFAMMELPLVVATLAQRFRFRMVPGHPIETEPLITLRPKHGVQMTIEARPGMA